MRLSDETGGLVSFVPTPAQRAGDFSALSTQIKDPLTNAQFPGNKIPADRVDPVIAKLLAYIPNSPVPDGRIVYSRPVQQQEEQFVVKTDYYLGTSHRLFGRYFYDRYNWDGVAIPSGNILGSYRGQKHYWHNATFGDTWTHGNFGQRFSVQFCAG